MCIGSPLPISIRMFSQGFLHPTITALLTCHLHMLTQGVHLLSSLCSVSLCQVPLICTNTHLQPTIEALFRVGTLLIQPVLYQELGSGHGQLPCRDYRAPESYYKYVNLSCTWCFIFIYGFIKMTSSVEISLLSKEYFSFVMLSVDMFFFSAREEKGRHSVWYNHLLSFHVLDAKARLPHQNPVFFQFGAAQPQT